MKHGALAISLILPLLVGCIAQLPWLAPGPAGKIELVSHIGGANYAVAAQGDYLYAGFGSELAVLDISNPTTPRRVGYVLLEGVVGNISVAGDYAYVLVASPYGHAEATGLQVVDISNPATPFEVQETAMSGHLLEVVAADASGRLYAYVALWGMLRVMDLSNPATPTMVNVLDAPGTIVDIAVADGYVYVAREICSLQTGCWRDTSVLDIADPAAPMEIGSLGVGPAGIAAADGRAYAAYDDGSLMVLDVSNPVNPIEMGAKDVLQPGSADVAVAGDYVYVANGETGGLQVVDVSDPAAPVEAGRYGAPGRGAHVAAADGYVYVANQRGALWIVDASDPARPALAGSHPAWAEEYAYGGAVAVAGGYAYVAAGSGLRVIDVSSPVTPTGHYTHDASFVIHGITLPGPDAPPGRYAYVVGEVARVRHGSDARFEVLDVSDPAKVWQAGYLEYSYGAPTGVAVVSDPPGHLYAYVTGPDGLHVIDASDATRPVDIGSHNTPGGAQAVAVAPDAPQGPDAPPGRLYAYVANGFSGLRVLDVSRPTAPAGAGYVGIAAFTRDVAVGNGHVYVTNDLEGLWVWDISDPTAPAHPRNFYLPGQPRVAVDGDLVYVLDPAWGLYILRVR